ncbi:MAG TPA: CRTAC1 family protein [Vicinamibacterales bacterium]
MTTRLPLSAAIASVLFAASIAAAPAIFEEVAARVGLDFVYDNGAGGEHYILEVMGAGGALVDYDNDGDLDVFLLQGQPLVPGAPPSGKTHRLYRNELVPSGALRFTDVTAGSGLGVKGYGMGVAAGDYDNDGDLDLYVTAFGRNTLFRNNNGDGTFTDVTDAAGVHDDRWSTSAAFVDYDRDGYLDLFVANYLDFTVAGNKQCFDPAGTPDYCSPNAYEPVGDRLFRNLGNGRFEDVTESAGIARADGAGLGVSIGDYNGDGWLDIYVANDATPNQLWLNERDGTFVDDGPLSGSALNAAGNPEGSMGIASGDYDADGDEDLFVTNIIGETFVLYRNDGSGSFDDVRVMAGLAAPTAPFTGFGVDWFDYDNDGWLDLFITNGAVNIVEKLRGDPVPYRMPDLLFRNVGDGRFEDVSKQAGPALARLEVGRGAAFGDIDNDGDIDVLVNKNDGPVRLLLNQVGNQASWLQLDLRQPGNNRFAVGALVTVERPGLPPLKRRVRSDGSYLVAQDTRVHFGLGTHTGPVAVIVHWPDGAAERWTIDKVRQRISLTRGSGSPATAGPAGAAP